MVNFGEIRRAQLAKYIPHLHVSVPGIFSDLLRSVQMLNRVWVAEILGKLPYLFQSLVKLQPWFLNLRWKNLPSAELQPRFLLLQ